MAGSSEVVEGWAEVCQRHAKAAAHEFAKACAPYSPASDHSAHPGLTNKDLLKKFIDTFTEQFDIEILKIKNRNKITNGHDESDYSEENESPKSSHKAFFRRLSFKALRRRGLFHKQHSDEAELSSNINKQNKTKLAKIVVECRKEGLVNYLTPESLEQPSGPQKWERCRLALVKTIGGYMLEFYSPPKATKPRSGVFCFLITEARETTALEMPDHENTFVLKADNNMEYVIEATDVDDMKSWLATIKYCMRAAPTSQPPPDALPAVPEPAPPDLPPRSQLSQSTSNLDLTADTPDEQELVSIAEEPPVSTTTPAGSRVSLADWPWFHGTLARASAAAGVLAGGAAAHGVYLVRQSETRRGEYVLTFNFQGRAKHLRMTLSDTGQCRVQHLWFPNVHEMLDHFRSHPIPLESGGTADVTLTEYVVCQDERQQYPLPEHFRYGIDPNQRRSTLVHEMAVFTGGPQAAVNNTYTIT